MTDTFTTILNAVLGWASQITGYMISDTLLALVLAIIIFSYVIKFFNKLKHLR